MKSDYTIECIDIINKIIEFAGFIEKPPFMDLHAENAVLANSIQGDYEDIYTVYGGAPKDVYRLALDKETFQSVQMDWAIWWAKEKKIISHHGPAGSKGWVLYTSEKITYDDVVVGTVSPFCPSSMLPYMQSILKYSGMIQEEALEEYERFDEKVSKMRSELEAEKDAARLERKLHWS